VGGASGTVAEAISAYDKAVSDDLYGAGSRYVSKQRLQAMLDKEWAELQTKLGKTRGLQTGFFSFADTATARNYTGTNDANGWVSVEQLRHTPPLGHLYAYLLAKNFFVSMKNPTDATAPPASAYMLG
jgi:hypothetical protein